MQMKDLQAYYWQVKEIQAISDQITEIWRDPLMSHDSVSHSTSVSDPTHAVIVKVDALQTRLTEKKDRLMEQTKLVEDWLDTIQDEKVRAIIRNHFMLGRSWRHTSKIVYGYATPEASKMVFRRFMQEN